MMLTLWSRGAAISEVARLAIKKRTGARALRNIWKAMLLEAMFQAPDDDVATVLVDELAVRGEEPVKLLSEKHDEQSWEEATKPDEKVPLPPSHCLGHRQHTESPRARVVFADAEPGLDDGDRVDRDGQTALEHGMTARGQTGRISRKPPARTARRYIEMSLDAKYLSFMSNLLQNIVGAAAETSLRASTTTPQ